MSKVKLNPNAQKWVDALRSGEYVQGKDSLRTWDRLCCLGVLSELAIENGVEIEKSISPMGIYSYNGDDCYAPTLVADWVGLTSKQGVYGHGNSCLAKKNDAGCTFSEIADLIELHAEELGVAEKNA